MSMWALAILAALIGWLIGSAWVAHHEMHHEMHEQAERDMRARRDAFRIDA